MAFDVPEPSPAEEELAQAGAVKTTQPRPRWIPPSLPNIPQANVGQSSVSSRSVGRQRRGKLITICAAGVTSIAFLIAFGLLIHGSDPARDFLSPPFALVGGILVILMMARRHRPGHLLISTILLNLTYWLYFLTMLLTSGNQ